MIQGPFLYFLFFSKSDLIFLLFFIVSDRVRGLFCIFDGEGANPPRCSPVLFPRGDIVKQESKTGKREKTGSNQQTEQETKTIKTLINKGFTGILTPVLLFR